jgi:molybdate/tungstate transport system ATP-binding protein
MIKFNKLNITLGNFKLKDMSLDINKGEYFVILGPSGAGKTIILELLAGLLKPDSGKLSGLRINKTALIYQDYMLFPHMNVRDNIAYGLKVRKTPKDKIEKTVKAIAEQLEISDLLDRDTLNLSGGEKQRVSIARASVIDPEVYLLDEPTAALDINTRSKILKTFSDIHKEKKATFIHVTHNFEEALFLADRIAVVNNGELIQLGTPDEIFDHPESKFVADFVGFDNAFCGNIKSSYFTPKNDPETKFHVPSEDSEKVHIAFKADDVILSNNKFESSARNSFQGTVESINKKLSLSEVTVLVNKTKFTSMITHDSLKEMKIFIGEPIWVTFKSSAVKVFPY